MKKINHLKIGKKTIKIEANGLDKLAKSIGSEFNDVCNKLLQTNGKIITLGIGKSGHIAKKVSATLSSTGSPSNFINAAEALHGDIGGINKSDKVLIFSHSGQSKEIIDLLPYLKNLGCDFFSITGSKDSIIAKSSNINIDTGISEEACPLDLAPTTSTTASLALGDAIAVALLEAKGFKADDFAKSHPGGKLGRRLILKVEDVMKKGKELPIVLPSDTLAKTLLEISSKGLGVALVIEKSNLKGIFTDGDLRRALNKKIDLLAVPISKLMSKKAKTIIHSALATEAIKLMQKNQIYSLVVLDQKKQPKGLIRMHDLVEAGLV
jgi:arabinose-5-phosphate isomerase